MIDRYGYLTPGCIIHKLSNLDYEIDALPTQPSYLGWLALLTLSHARRRGSQRIAK